MAGYRIFELSRNGRIVGPSVLVQFTSDTEAQNFVTYQRWKLGCEVWCGTRKVCRVPPTVENSCSDQR